MSQPDEQRRYTLDEFFSLAGDERMELYEGTMVLMSPAPYEHEGVVANLIAEFRMALKGSSCLVFGSNLQVVFLFEDEQKGKRNVTVLPDLAIVCDRTKLRQGRCYGAPDLVVEVLSPSTARNDRLFKRYYYEKAGVREYWIVDYQHQTMEKYVWQSGTFHLEDVYDVANGMAASTVFPEVRFSVEEIFAFLSS
ncbi:Uma2 family endonuclease [Geobacillus sp. C56-T2]|uniref:Uma2 family endonuclease n=1 Tax=Geobacillus sp. C56-T2 TaxID=600773 RepID=UPI00119E478E|nr:Uma2 family endonuclease [Geobacillus sp. C56-T2]NNV06278.1 Uma2 family endonuclease [Geobacillus sp. MMMUD3]TWG30259.1 Uma2 family endonuclease [Geobacillus sp. C56-T2]